jgi:sugar transferase (PEP-CTERM/EpsH1 system associated)
MLDHLARSFEVEVGCLVDDRADLDHLPALRRRFAHVEAPFVPGGARAAARALLRVRPNGPLTLGWFHNRQLAQWVSRGLGQGRYGAVFVFSSVMATPRHPVGQRRVLDMVDVDSEKFAAYAGTARPPMRQVYSREARTLLALERRAAVAFDRTVFVSEAEAARFATLAPECAPQLGFVENGVDFTRFDPGEAHASPFATPGPHLVFTGTMGYRPNIEAVTWFAESVLPLLRTRAAPPEFHVVGANPAPAVRALAALQGVHVTGTVPDVRPYLAHAAVAVAPLLTARGIQNKVLEAMAMARPVVATPQAFEGIRATPGRDLLVADGAAATAEAVAQVLDGAAPGLGAAGRAAVIAGHDWAATLRPLDALLGA